MRNKLKAEMDGSDLSHRGILMPQLAKKNSKMLRLQTIIVRGTEVRRKQCANSKWTVTAAAASCAQPLCVELIQAGYFLTSDYWAIDLATF